MTKLPSFLAKTLADQQDGSGVFGGIFHYSMIVALVGSALLAFIYLWRKRRLDFDEEPKWQMILDSTVEEGKSRMRPEDQEEIHGKQQ